MRRRAFWLSALVFATLFIWAWKPVFSVGFLADDYEWFRYVSDLRSWDLWRIFWYPALGAVRFARYRPLVGLTFWSDFRLFGYQAWGYHLTNLFFHGLAVIGVFLVASSLLRRKKGGVVAALISAGLFSVSPILVEAVTWVDGRYDVIASALILFSLWMFLRGYRGRSRGLWLGASSFLGGMSLLAKETAVILPFIVCTIIIYSLLERYNKVGIDSFFREVKRVQIWFWIFLLGAGFYVWLGSLSLGKFVFLEKGYSIGISRPFLAWIILTMVGISLRWVRLVPMVSRRVWLSWWWVGLSLVPISFLPTQLRFLFLPAALATVCVVLRLSDFRPGRRVLSIGGLVVVVLVFSLGLRSRNFAWVEASRGQRQIIGQISEKIEEAQPRLMYLFNLPDHIRGIPAFRSYVEEAILLEAERLGKSFPRNPIDIIPGPMTDDLGETGVQVLDSSRVVVTSSKGFVIFPPSVVRRFPDGSSALDWGGDWQATASADRKRMWVSLPHGLDEAGVSGLIFSEGRIENVFPR